ncbi:serine/arginine-rich splicing factor 11-like [Schistocerca americana]|uniref:serine/arginine-rich splicing factor 11-like n=1 Tax=Schistocerca americana TaxID=7009 RepID=UPI001F50124F|nr:serine/arginine-rich splicing factor 11-like [Schistocerca americana]
MAPTFQGGNQTGGRKRLLTVISEALKHLGDGRGSSPKQILAWVEKNPTIAKRVDEPRLLHTLKRAVEAGVLTARGGRYKLAARDDDRELCCRRRRRRSCRRRRRRSCRRRRRSCRRRRRSCRRRRRSCRRRRRRSCRRRRRRSCRRRRRSCRRRRRRSCRRRRRRRRRRRCSSDADAASLASVDAAAGQSPGISAQSTQHALQQN